ncbi:MAG: hypothetical protein CVU42_07125 [Chloroflexi bacterium HGW-Chloroflexi-4]|nr:MAG: hypothetical protein CVU42_07125 [Chloroflexi bacterium HGW-Chloroflexi-4]
MNQPLPWMLYLRQSWKEARKLFEQESIKPKPTIAAISQEEIDLLKAMQNEPAPPSVDAVSQAEIEARKLFEQESIKPKPAINGISQEEIDLLKAMQETNSRPQTNDLSETEIAARKLFEQESLNKATIAANDVSQIDLDALGLTEQESLKAEAENPSNISEQELAELTKMLDQMPDPDPQPGAEIAVEEKKLPEWLTELETADNATMAQPSDNTQPRPAEDSVPAGIPPFLVIDESLKSAIEKGEPLPEIDFKLPWEDEENTVKVATENLSTQTVEPKSDEILENVNNQPVQVAEPVLQTEIEALKPAAATFAEVLETVSPQVEKSTETMPAMVESAALTVSESMATQETETSSTPPSLKDFRFNYTLVLMPGDHNHFLTKNLSDKLSTIMPDIHEDQGWKMTSITIRPQYLLWTVAVRFGVCPNQIMQEVRNLTSNSIFANFPEIAKVKTSNDFWSSNYLAVSGSEPAQANLIFDFVNDAWKTPEAAAL